MAKRSRKRKSSAPNLPQEALDRARKQLDGTLEDEEIEEDDTPQAEAVEEANEEDEAKAEPAVKSSRTTIERSSRRRERRTSGSSSSSRSSGSSPTTFQSRKRGGELDNQEIAHLLANPTKVVSEEELHEEYGYVLRDLRNMGVLAAVLMIFLVLLAQFI